MVLATLLEFVQADCKAPLHCSFIRDVTLLIASGGRKVFRWFLGYVNYFSHIIKFKVHPHVKDTSWSPETGSLGLSQHPPTLASA